MLAQSFFWKLPETETVILRPVHILGSVHNAPSNFLRLNPIVTVMGFDPMIQVVHQSEVVRAIELALDAGRSGASSTSPDRSRCPSRAHQDPRAPANRRAVFARADGPGAYVVATLDHVPGSRARSHPLRLHGRRSPGAAGSRVHSADVRRGDRAFCRRRPLVVRRRDPSSTPRPRGTRGTGR